MIGENERNIEGRHTNNAADEILVKTKNKILEDSLFAVISNRQYVVVFDRFSWDR